jgi:hypothetical protein
LRSKREKYSVAFSRARAVSELSLAPMAPVTVSLGYRLRNLIATVQALKARLTFVKR